MSAASCPSVLPTATILPTANSHQTNAMIASTCNRAMR
jgi:hypothetical protein